MSQRGLPHNSPKFVQLTSEEAFWPRAGGHGERLIKLMAVDQAEFSRRLSFLGVAAGAGALALGAPRRARGAHAERPSPPNLVLITADALVYGDLSGYGRADFQTPVLDRLAAQGTRFTVRDPPICTPTRVGLMTGRCPARHPVEGRTAPLPYAEDRVRGWER